MKKLALGLWLALWALGPALAQQVTNPLPNAGIYGAYNSGAQTCVSGTGCWVQTDINGNLKVAIAGAGTTTANQGTAGTNAQAWWVRIGDATNGPAAVKPASTAAVAGDPSIVVQLNPLSPGITALGPATDVNSVPGVLAPTGNSAGGITPVVGGSAVSSLVLKASAGSLFSVYANCTAACWLMVFNATAAPSNGATTAGIAASNMVECIPIGAGSIGGLNYDPYPAVYTTGITATISSTACATLTLSTVGFIHGMIK